jgi:hypothetical protein
MEVLRYRHMPKYTFNLVGNGELHEGHIPLRLASIEEARAEVAQAIHEIVVDAPNEWPFGTLGFCFQICDEYGELIESVPFRSVLLLH